MYFVPFNSKKPNESIDVIMIIGHRPLVAKTGAYMSGGGYP